jgi:hypothetical protein
MAVDPQRQRGLLQDIARRPPRGGRSKSAIHRGVQVVEAGERRQRVHFPLDKKEHARCMLLRTAAFLQFTVVLAQHVQRVAQQLQPIGADTVAQRPHVA